MLPIKYVLVAAAITIAGLGASTYVLSLKLDNAQSQLQAEKIGRKSDRDKYVAAQAVAKATAERIKAEKEAKYAKDAAEADERTLYWRNKFNASVMRYQQTVRGKVSRPDLPGTTDEAKGSDGPSGDTFISITVNDANICATNTARLLSAHEWATKPE